MMIENIFISGIEVGQLSKHVLIYVYRPAKIKGVSKIFWGKKIFPYYYWLWLYEYVSLWIFSDAAYIYTRYYIVIFTLLYTWNATSKNVHHQEGLPQQ